MARRLARIGAVLSIWAASSFAQAHELPDNRATFVVRDDNHVSVTLYLNFPEVLRRVIAPQRSFAEFVLVYSALDADALKAALDDAQRTMSQQLSITDSAGRPPIRARWEWPSAEATRTELQMLAAQLLVAPDQTPHDEPAEVRGDVLLSTLAGPLKAVFPRAFDRVLTISYRPRQVWAEPGQPAPDIRF